MLCQSLRLVGGEFHYRCVRLVARPDDVDDGYVGIGLRHGQKSLSGAPRAACTRKRCLAGSACVALEVVGMSSLLKEQRPPAARAAGG